MMVHRAACLVVAAVQAFDIWLTFNTAYFHDEDGLVRDKKKIAHKYLGFWFIPDLFWCLPLRHIFALNHPEALTITQNGWLNFLNLLVCL